MHRLLPVYRADPNTYDLSSIRRFWDVGPLPAHCQGSMDRVARAGPTVGVLPRPRTSGVHRHQRRRVADPPGLGRPGTSGEMKVLDDDGRERAPGVVGEVFTRPPKGSAPTYRYIGATARSATARTRSAISAISTRTATFISTTAGWTCSPWGAGTSTPPKSRRLAAHPDALSCLVVGVPDDVFGQVAHAIVQADGLDEDTVIAFPADRIERYKVPRPSSSPTPRCGRRRQGTPFGSVRRGHRATARARC